MRASKAEARRPRRAPRPAAGAIIRAPAHAARTSARSEEVLYAWAALSTADPAPDAKTRRRDAQVLPTPEVAAGFDLLRVQLLQAARTRGWHVMGVTAPAPGCGASFVTAGLASSLARLDTVRTIVLDMDLTRPSLARAFSTEAPGTITDMFDGHVPIEGHLRRLGENLALGLTLPCPDGGSTMSRSDAIADTLAALDEDYAPNLILFDLPPLLTSDTALALLPHLGGVLIVADGTRTQASDLHECERLLQERTQLLGVVLNRGTDRAAGRRRLK